jgi:protoporphyrinogen oxidase
MSSRICIIGGGISGLASALQLAKQGHDVTVLEAGDSLGGLGTFFDFGDRRIDRFYHCIMPRDSHLLGLIEELDLSHKMYWQDTRMGLVWGGSHFPFNGPIDLLRFTPLSLLQRLRLGMGALVLPHLGRDEVLDRTPIRDWLTRLFGRSLWDKFWGPLFTAKFGVGAANLPSLYLSQRLGRESNVAKRGYLEGGLAGLIDALAEAIRERQGAIHLNTRVEAIEQQGSMVRVRTGTSSAVDYDCVVSTIPISTLARIAKGLDGVETLPELTYQGVVNLLILLKRPPGGFYWTPILHSETDFDGVVESSALIRPEQYGGHHAVYLMKYAHRDSDLFGTDEDEIADRWTDQFLRIFEPCGITADDVAHRFVFKAPYVEPLYPLNYVAQRPSLRVGRSNLFLATTAQVYPGITCWDSSAGVAASCATAVEEHLRAAGTDAQTRRDLVVSREEKIT